MRETPVEVLSAVRNLARGPSPRHTRNPFVLAALVAAAVFAAPFVIRLLVPIFETVRRGTGQWFAIAAARVRQPGDAVQKWRELDAPVVAATARVVC